jgi:hypothetical protein
MGTTEESWRAWLEKLKTGRVLGRFRFVGSRVPSNALPVPRGPIIR